MQMPVLRPVPFNKADKRLRTLLGYIRKWEVAETYYIPVPGSFTILIPAGFIFDGASIPKIIRCLLSPMGVLLIPAIVHDFCYHMHFLHVEDKNGTRNLKIITKEEADLLFLKIANEANGMPWINNQAYLAVKYFGHKAWK